MNLLVLAALKYYDFFPSNIHTVVGVTPTELAIQELVKATKPGGRVLIWVYGPNNEPFISHRAQRKLKGVRTARSGNGASAGGTPN